MWLATSGVSLNSDAVKLDSLLNVYAYNYPYYWLLTLYKLGYVDIVSVFWEMFIIVCVLDVCNN